MSGWLSYDRVFRVINVRFELVTRSPLRIGAGRAVVPTSPIDLQVLRIHMNGRDVPYIPGSSVKGVFRSASELIAKSRGIKVCMAGEGCRESYNRELDEFVRDKNFDEVRKLLEKYCLTCKIFGSGSFSSHVAFSDFYPTKDPAIGAKTGIAIDRRSGSVKRGALYTVEFIMPGASFQGTITITNLPNYAIGLLSSVVELVNQGFVKIGGFKSRGFGRCELKPIEIDGYVFSDGRMEKLKDVKVFRGLEKSDLDVDVSECKTPSEYLDKFKVAWDNYAASSAR